MEYTNFELSISSRGGTSYEVTARTERGEDARAKFEFDVADPVIRNRLATMQRDLLSRRGVRAPQPPAGESSLTIQDFGALLFRLAVSDHTTIDRLYHTDRSRARGDHNGMRLWLRIQPPELAELPWEFLYDESAGEDEFIGLSPDTPVVRYLELDRAQETLEFEGPLRVLVLLSGPSDLGYLAGKDHERELIHDALDGLVEESRLEVDYVEPATFGQLQHMLRQKEWHVFHFIGHGDVKDGEGLLALERDDGTSHMVSANDVQNALQGNRNRPPRLAVLNSCEGARASGRLFSSTAARLIQGGVPAAIAMQYEVSDLAAVRFAGEFYRSFADGYPVERAVSDARQAIKVHEDSLEWGTPVLFMRSPSGAVMPRPESKPGKPRHGSLVSKLCDRKEQEKDFARFLNRHVGDPAGPGPPLVFLLPGPEGSAHDSFVQRLVKTTIGDLAESLGGSERGTPFRQIVEWPHADTQADEQLEDLAIALAKTCKPPFRGEMTPDTLAGLQPYRSYPIVVVEHLITADDWGRVTGDVIGRYVREFWATAQPAREHPQFMIFLKIHVPSDGRLGRLFSRAKRLRTALAAMGSTDHGCPCMVFREMEAVTRSDLIEWFQFDVEQFYSEAKRQELVQELLEGADSVPMMHVEDKLKEIHDRYTAELAFEQGVVA